MEFKTELYIIMLVVTENNPGVNLISQETKNKQCLLLQRSRGRQIRRPWTRKLGLGRIILPKDDSRDARLFRRETSQCLSLPWLCCLLAPRINYQESIISNQDRDYSN